MNNSQTKKIERFIKFIFKTNKEAIAIHISVTERKRKSSTQIGSKILGLSFRRRDFITKLEEEEDE